MTKASVGICHRASIGIHLLQTFKIDKNNINQSYSCVFFFLYIFPCVTVSTDGIKRLIESIHMYTGFLTRLRSYVIMDDVEVLFYLLSSHSMSIFCVSLKSMKDLVFVFFFSF